MAVLRIGVVWFSLLTVASTQLQCHVGQTSTYQYRNDIKLWGEVEQTFEVSCTVDIDCKGESSLSTKDKPAFDFVAHFSDVTVKERSIKPNDAVKLCKPSQDKDSTCGLITPADENDSDEKDEDDAKVVRDQRLFTLPVHFHQTSDGTIIRIQFMEKDFENVDVMNMKKGIISTLQTHINTETKEEVEDETDSNGRHKTHYSSNVSGDETVVTKEYDSDEDVDVDGNPGKLHVKEQATVQNGEITSSTGAASSQSHNKDDSDEDDDDSSEVVPGIEVGDLLKSESNYSITLKHRRKRSAERTKRMATFKTTDFIESAITMTNRARDEDDLFDQLERLYEQLEQTTVYDNIDSFLHTKDEDNLEKLKAIITLETKIGYGKVKVKLRRTEPPLVDILVPLTYGLLAECHGNWDTCAPLLSLFALGGGSKAEQVFQYMLSTDSQLTSEQLMDMVDIASTMANPSDEYISMMLETYQSESTDPQLTRSLLLGLGSLSGQDSISDNLKFIVRSIIRTQIVEITERNCTEDEKYVDALEAAGNMADEELLGILVDIGSTCGNSRILQTAVLHAVRGLLNNPSTVNLLITILESGDCEISEEVLHMLIDAMADMRSEDILTEWPLVGLNEFDHALEYMLTQTENLDCIRNTVMKYLRKKIQTDTEAILTRLRTTDQHHQTNGAERLRKRSLQHSTCSVWDDYGGRYSSIQSSYAFRSDRNNYNRRKHCLAHFRVGSSKATADVYGGFFTGCNTANSRGKLFGRVVANGQVFRKSYNIATIYTYLYNSGSSVSGSVYARVGGRTFISESFRTQPSIVRRRLLSGSLTIRLLRIPLYITSININLRVSTGVYLNVNLLSCYGTSTCLKVIPSITARASIGASISLAVIRGGANVGFNFNYHLKAEVRLKSACQWPCISLSHGHDRNSISIEFWYQIRSKFRVKLWPPWKIRFEWKWGSRKTYGPNSLKWEVGRSSDRAIASSC